MNILLITSFIFKINLCTKEIPVVFFILNEAMSYPDYHHIENLFVEVTQFSPLSLAKFTIFFKKMKQNILRITYNKFKILINKILFPLNKNFFQQKHRITKHHLNFVKI